MRPVKLDLIDSNDDKDTAENNSNNTEVLENDGNAKESEKSDDKNTISRNVKYAEEVASDKKVSNDEKHTYSCDNCSFKGKNKNSFTTHKRRAHGTIHKCKECKFFTRILRRLTLHERKHVDSQIQQFECVVGECPKKYRQDTRLSRHKTREHGAGGNHTCKNCNKVFTFKEALRVHLGVIHQEGSYKKKTYYCDFCSHVNYCLYNLKKHNSLKHKK